MTKLDYSLNSPEDRLKLVEQILSEAPNPSQPYLESLADYLVLCMEKQEKKEKKMLTDNRLSTVNKHECSFEGLVSQLENGEDGIYNLAHEDKNMILQPKVMITQQDVDDIPCLKQLREAIKIWENKAKAAVGRDAYIIRHTIMDLRKDQYIIKNAYRKPLASAHPPHSHNFIELREDFDFDDDGFVIPSGVSLLDPRCCSAILCNYSRLKQDSWGQFESDVWGLMLDFDRVSTAALKNYPLYEKLVEYKIDGLSNLEIQERLQLEFGIKHSVEYISSLWRNKIPKLIASEAEDEFLDVYYLNNIRGQYKKCSRCGQIKLKHNKYFSRNKTSKDGYYSICKQCRNTKKTDEDILI